MRANIKNATFFFFFFFLAAHTPRLEVKLFNLEHFINISS